MAAAEEGVTAVRERRIAWSAAGSGPPVLLLHGFGADRATWLQTVPALGPGARVFALDLPGHGASDPDVGDGSIPFLADVVRGVIGAHNLAGAHVVAHSLGAAIALALAASDPDLFSGMALIAPAGLGPHINRDFTDGFVAMHDEESARSALSLLVARPSLISRQMVRDTLAFVGRSERAAALRQIVTANFTDGIQRYRYDEALAGLNLPWSLIWGGGDRVLSPPPVDSSLARRIVTIADAGHMPHMERPAAVNRLLLEAIGRAKQQERAAS